MPYNGTFRRKVSLMNFIYKPSVTLFRMIAYQTLHGALKDGAELETFDASGLTELLLEVPGDTANTGNGQFPTSIRSDMTGEERTEVVNNEVLNGRHVYVVVDELGERTKESVGQRLTIDTIDDHGQRKTRFRLELSLEFRGQPATIKVVEKPFAQHCPTPLVADDITQGGRVLNDLLTIIEARIGSCAQDAGNTRPTATEGTCGTQHIAVGLDADGLGQSLAQLGSHRRLLLRTHTTTIKIDTQLSRVVGATSLYTSTHLTQRGCDEVRRLMIGIQSLCGERGQNGEGGGQNAPVSLRAAAVCNQYHIIKCYIPRCKSKNYFGNKEKFCGLFARFQKKPYLCKDLDIDHEV